MIHNAVVPSGYDTVTKFSWAATDLASLDCSSPDARRFKRIFLMIRLCSVQMRLCWERFGTMLGTLIKWVPRHCPPAHLLQRPASQSRPGPGLKTRRPSFPTKPFLVWRKLLRATLLGKPIALRYSSDVQSGSPFTGCHSTTDCRRSSTQIRWKLAAPGPLRPGRHANS